MKKELALCGALALSGLSAAQIANVDASVCGNTYYNSGCGYGIPSSLIFSDSHSATVAAFLSGSPEDLDFFTEIGTTDESPSATVDNWMRFKSLSYAQINFQAAVPFGGVNLDVWLDCDQTGLVFSDSGGGPFTQTVSIAPGDYLLTFRANQDFWASGSYARAEYTFDYAIDPRNVFGYVLLGDYLMPPDSKSLSVEVYSEDGSALLYSTSQVVMDGGGNFAFFQSEPSGTYDVRFKVDHWLAKKLDNVILNPGGNVGEVALVNGDVDNDNEIGPGDFGLLSSAFGSVSGDSSFLPEADLDGDGEVGPSDFGILSAHFGLAGD